MKLIKQIAFGGEESSRFTRFGQFLLQTRLQCHVVVEGRDPLTSRQLTINGILVDAVLDGYLRYVVVQEDGSGIEFWVAGSNSIRSVATRRIVFQFSLDNYQRLNELAAARGTFVPGLAAALGDRAGIWHRLDLAPSKLNAMELAFLLECMKGHDVDVAREAALALRAFATFATSRKSQQAAMEASLLQALETVTDRDTRVAIVEDLGYVGTYSSYNSLASLAVNVNEEPQVRWAAGVALSRLPGDRVIGPLVRLVETAEGWIAAGALLGLARHASTDNQAILEPVFYRCLTSTADRVLQRYACLGLSRFDHLADHTFASVADLLRNQELGIDVRGFAALVVSSCLTSLNSTERARVAQVVLDLSQNATELGTGPEGVWGLEFMAELATLLELNEPSARLSLELASKFDDWRSGYYSALASYELGEASCRAGDSFAALEHFQEALAVLGRLTAASSADEETIRFRREIVAARASLQEVLVEWRTALDADDVLRLANELDGVTAVYARYSRPSRSTDTTIKRLSQRETEYMRKTLRLLQVVKLAMRLDADVRSLPLDSPALAASIARLGEALDSLRSQFGIDTPLGPRRLLDDVSTIADRLRLTLRLQHADARDLLDAASELRSSVERGTWPMPARACPIGGLGRGEIGILQEDIPGDGSEASPYLFPADSPAVLNVVVELKEMAPGGNTSAYATCTVGTTELQQRLDAVEGAVRVSFVLPDVLSTATATRCDLQLTYRARDCQQTAARLTVYLRRAQWNRRSHF